MRIIAAVFIDTIQLREAPGPSTRIDLGGVKFSEAAPSPVPVTVEPHLVVLVYCPKDHKGEAALEVTYTRDGEQIARNVQMLAVEPGKFNYRLVRAELTFDEYGTVEASCRIDLGDPVIVPYTLLAPVES
ncbi:MAG: lipid 3-O-deacylase [Acidimicrobiaceae bacterium]